VSTSVELEFCIALGFLVAANFQAEDLLSKGNLDGKLGLVVLAKKKGIIIIRATRTKVIRRETTDRTRISTPRLVASAFIRFLILSFVYVENLYKT
jgi:hypothetical protein